MLVLVLVPGRLPPQNPGRFEAISGPPINGAAAAGLVDHRRTRHHDASMRTTLTLDPDVVRLIEEEVHRGRKSTKQVVNEAIRKGLAPKAASRSHKRYRVKPHQTTLCPGIDIGSFNKLADELEDEAVVEKVRSGR